MRIEQLSNMTKGWFAGDFTPAALHTKAAEVAVKTYPAGAYEQKHYHKIATEITVVVSGTVEMNGVQYQQGTIIVIEPGEATDFRAVTDVVNTVVKIPSCTDDKYVTEDDK